MSQIKAFFDKAFEDNDLMAKLDELAEKGIKDEDVIALAAEHGFTITKEEIEIMKSHSCSICKSCEIKEEELENTTGGYNPDAPSKNRWDPKRCMSHGRTMYECVGFMEIVNCDHYRKIDLDKGYRHICMMGAFDYRGNFWGTPTG